MKRHFCFTLLAFSTVTFATAQKLPTPSFMLGPVIGVDRIGHGGGEILYGGTYPKPTAGRLTLGLDGSYQVNRWLFRIQPLYTKRIYGEYIIPPEPTCGNIPLPLCDLAPTRFRNRYTDLQVLSVPFSVSYQLTRSPHFQWYVGGNVAVEYLCAVGTQTRFDHDGSLLSKQAASMSDLGRRLNVGYGLQTTFRYLIASRLCLQVEPSARYYPKGGFPSSAQHTLQFQATAGVLVRLE